MLKKYKKLIILGLGALLLISLILPGAEDDQQNVVADAAPPKVETKILISKNTVARGQLLTQDHVSWATWPEDHVHQGYLIKASTSLEDYQSAVVRDRLSPGQPITRDKLVFPGERGFLAAILRPGMRATTIGVNATTGVAGFVFPGDQVDVILTHSIRNDQDEVRPLKQASETVLTNVRVLATDQRFKDTEEETPTTAKTVTLEVKPRQAEILMVAQNLGQLSLSLRGLQIEEQAKAKAVQEPAALPASDVKAEESASETAAKTAVHFSDPHPDAQAAQPIPEPMPTRGGGYTWDSQASSLLSRADSEGLTVLRGGMDSQTVSVP